LELWRGASHVGGNCSEWGGVSEAEAGLGCAHVLYKAHRADVGVGARCWSGKRGWWCAEATETEEGAGRGESEKRSRCSSASERSKAQSQGRRGWCDNGIRRVAARGAPPVSTGIPGTDGGVACGSEEGVVQTAIGVADYCVGCAGARGSERWNQDGLWPGT